MAFSIVILACARQQILDAVSWWRANRPAALSLLEDELDQAFTRLAEHPGLGTLAPWTDPRVRGVRRLLLVRVERVIVYRVRPRAARVEILALWPARRPR